MKISYNWLQRHIKEKLPDAESLKETIIFHAFEVEDIEEKNGDTIMDIKVLPDRAHDCLGHAGMAKEIVGLLGLTYISYPLPDLPTAPLAINVEIHSDLCRRYIAIEMKDIDVGPSPAWLKDAIESVGMRSINNVVDATNLILLDDGQPVHAYDADKIDGGIVVRLAHEGEQITTLSQEVKELKSTDLVIGDYLGPLAIAGVKGGVSAEITEKTGRIIVEIGNFDPIAIRKTSRRLSLVTDASKRFENEITPEIAYEAARHVVGIIQKVAGGEVVGVFDHYPAPVASRTLSFTLLDITRLLGATITAQTIDLWISRYGISSTKAGDVYTITVPVNRLDITGSHDIAEEIGKLVGYETMPAAPLPFVPTPTSGDYERIYATKYWLAQNGFREVVNYSFVKKGEVYISYGPKDKSALRSTLSDGLKESYEKNKLNAAILGLDSIRIFEIGTVFLKDTEEMRVATCDKGTFEELPLAAFMEKYKIDMVHTGDVSLVASSLFTMWSLYPSITRDMAVWVSTPEDQKILEDIVTAFALQYCVREPVLFDHFEKDGRISIAYRFVFQSYEKTMTEGEVETWFAELVKKIHETERFEIR